MIDLAQLAEAHKRIPEDWNGAPQWREPVLVLRAAADALLQADQTWRCWGTHSEKWMKKEHQSGLHNHQCGMVLVVPVETP